MPEQYRIVRYYHQFFNRWAVRLEKRQVTRLLFWKFERWARVCDNPFDVFVPKGWHDFNIVDTITIKKLEA